MKKQLNARQEAKLNSIRSTEMHVDDNIAVINHIPAFLAAYDKIKTKITLLLGNVEQKSAALEGIAAGKTTFRQIVTGKTVSTAGVVYSYAADIADETLRQEMNVNKSRLDHTRDDELAPLCQFIHDRALEHLDALGDYNMTAAKLAALKTAIDNFSAAVPKPRIAVSGRKITNINISAILKDIDNLFEIFDRQIESLTEEHPDFVRTYFSTREIIDPPTKPNKTVDLANKTKEEALK